MDGTLWAIVGLAGALVMRIGFAMHGVGMARAKNAASLSMRYLCDLCIAVVAFVLIGLAILSVENGVLGFRFSMLLGWSELNASLALHGIAAVMIASAIVPGALAERSAFWPAQWGGALLGGIIVPLGLMWTGGWLGRLGMVDRAGAASLHWAGGLCALIGAYFAGPREGKYHRDGSASAIPGHSIPMSAAGTMLLLAGWAMFIGAMAGPMAVVNLVASASAGGIAALVLGQVRYYKPDIHLMTAGMLGAMVAISAAGGRTNLLGAVVVGGIAGVLVPLAVLMIDITFRIDDPVGAVAIHGVGGALGMLMAPVVAGGVGFVERLKMLGAQAVGLMAIGIVAAGLSIGLWLLLGRTSRLRVGEAAEFDGLDLAEHDVAAYPDFQQSMIKSYDLRQL